MSRLRATEIRTIQCNRMYLKTKARLSIRSPHRAVSNNRNAAARETAHDAVFLDLPSAFTGRLFRQPSSSELVRFSSSCRGSVDGRRQKGESADLQPISYKNPGSCGSPLKLLHVSKGV